MNYRVFILILCLGAALASTHAEEPDTIASTALDELVVDAPTVVRKSDMDVYHPSQSVIDNSKNGMQVLRNLMIPAVSVNEALGTVTSAGQAVQVRINGREATPDQVKALLPQTIRRVEWIDNPGLRYNGATTVLNFIVRNPDLGGSLMVDAMPALNAAWGQYFAEVKLNHGRSQWELGGHFKLTNKMRVHREYRETFTAPDGTSVSRDERSLGGRMDNSRGRARLAYSYVRPDTTVLYLSLDAGRNFSDRFHYRGMLTYSDRPGEALLNDINGSNGTTPRLSVYLEQHFARRQMIVVDFNASLYAGRSYHSYVETDAAAGATLTDVSTSIRDFNQAYAVEADYIKNWNNSRLTAGVSYTANRNRSRYLNLDGEVFHQRQDKMYFFAEYFRRIRKVTLTAGLGAQYTSFMFRESGRGNDSWSLRPRLSVTYSPAPGHQLQLGFTSWQSAPSLAETNIAPQQIDGFQWRVGNQSLKTSTSYMLTLHYGFGFPRVSGSFGVRAFTSPDAITPCLYWDSGRLITSYENSRGLDNLSFWLAPQIEVVPGWFALSGVVQYRAERMRGNGYRHYSQCWSGQAMAQVTHWGFTLTAQYTRAQRDLWGEKISWGEDVSVVMLGYNWKQWQLCAGMLMPFGRYDQGAKSLSRYNTNETHMRLDMRMPFVQLSYNLQWGRQKRGARKLVNADANPDRSTTGGR